MFTPADVTTPPHWAYPVGSSSVVDVGELEVETFRERESFKGRIKRYYWGYGLAPATKAKAKRLCRDGETFHFTFEGYGLATVHIGPLVKRPFLT